MKEDKIVSAAGIIFFALLMIILIITIFNGGCTSESQQRKKVDFNTPDCKEYHTYKTNRQKTKHLETEPVRRNHDQIEGELLNRCRESIDRQLLREH